MELNCSKKQRKAFIEDLLLMYEKGICDFSALTIMLLTCPELNVADFLRSNTYQKMRSGETEKVTANTSLIDFVRHRVEELYSDDSK